MNIAIIGYGKMGKEIEKVAREKGHQIPLIIDIHNQEDLNKKNLEKVDVAIEFTTPQSVIQNLYQCFEADVPVVTGSTGWNDKKEEVENHCRTNGKTLFHASNFSIGVNVLFKLNEYLAKLMNNLEQYNVEIEETHHTQKLDSPSGTAITLTTSLISNIERKKDWEENTKNQADMLNIIAKRIENVFGIHTIRYESDVDTIELTHSAKSRKGFASGAVIAAEFIQGKTGVFNMNDVLQF